MTDLELAMIRTRHHQYFVGVPGTSFCEGPDHLVDQIWPCETVRLLARIEELEKGLRAVLREHWESATPGSRGLLRHCGICSPQEKRWPCTTVLEARAALGGEDG